MKKATLFLTLSLLLIAAPAFGQPDLIGRWCVYMSEAVSGGGPVVGSYFDGDLHEADPEEIEILEQGSFTYGILFHGEIDHGGGELGHFSGVLDGRNISITHWDSVTRGELRVRGNHPLEIHFINNAFFADENERMGKTAIGVAVKGVCP